MNTKICSKCKEEKENKDFYKRSLSKDGFDYTCKQCNKEIHVLKVISGKAKAYSYKRNRQKTLKGQCQNCKQKNLITSKYCLYHFIANIIKNWKLPKETKEPTIQGLIKKLKDSEYCCHYSGLKITPGFSASIDHRIPQAKGGSHELSNLVWCHRSINLLKNDFSEKEFINRSSNILVELNYLDSKGEL